MRMASFVKTHAKLLWAAAVALLLIGSVVAQTKPAIRREQVSDVISRDMVAEKGYTVDLTRRGKVYTVASEVDRNKVRLHTSKGDLTVAEVLSRAGKRISGPVRVGTTADMRAQFRGRGVGVGGGRRNFTCGDLACVCSGDDDCNDMFTNGGCGPIAVCYPDGCVCVKL